MDRGDRLTLTALWWFAEQLYSQIQSIKVGDLNNSNGARPRGPHCSTYRTFDTECTGLQGGTHFIIGIRSSEDRFTVITEAKVRAVVAAGAVLREVLRRRELAGCC